MRASLRTAAVSVLLCAACATAPPQPRLTSRITTDSGKIQSLRYKVFGYVGVFSATVEDTADTIARTTADSTVRKNALLWKMNAIPAGLTATVHPDPLATLLDVWALSAQMEQYFSEGAGKETFGAQQRVAIDASRALTAGAIAIARDFVPPDTVDKGIALVDGWVAAHPLKTPLFARDSAVELVAPFMAKEGESIAGALGGLEDRVDSLTARLTVYGAFMPKLVRWHAELMLLGVPDTLIAVQDRVLQSVQDERRALIDAIDHQRVEAFDQIREERIALIKDLEVASARTIRDATSAIQPQIERERTAALAAIDAMRIQSLKDVRDILASVNDKRLDTLEYIHGERVATTRDAEQIAIKTVDHAFRQLYRLLAVIYLATLAGGAILIVLWKKLARDSRSG